MSGGKGGQSYTVGYRYFVRWLHMVIAHGPCDAIDKIWVGDSEVWNGNNTGGTDVIDRYNLWGGESGEGGIRGPFTVYMGNQDNIPEISAERGTRMGFKKVVSVVLSNFMLAMMNPYPKPWRFRVRRIPYRTYTNATIGGYAANPAYIILDALTSHDFGAGVDPENIDIASFQAVAAELAKEQFGLCVKWDAQEPVSDLIQEILETIDGSIRQDPITGLITLSLLRYDYDVNAIPIFNEDNVKEISAFNRPAAHEIINCVNLTYTKWEDGTEATVTMYDTANQSITGAVNAQTIARPYIPTETLARSVAFRDLRQLSAGLARITFSTNRDGAYVSPGDPINVSWQAYGIISQVYRVVAVTYGDSTSPTNIVIDAVEGIFGISTAKHQSEDTGWEPPSPVPVPVTQRKLFEYSRYMVAVFITGDAQSAWDDIGPDAAFLGALCLHPGGTTSGVKACLPPNWEVRNNIDFSESLMIQEDLDDIQTQFLCSFAMWYSVRPGDAIVVDDEVMKIVSFSTTAITVARGAGDTVPVPHLSGSIGYHLGNYSPRVNYQYLKGQTAQVKLQPFTSQQDMPIASVPTDSLTMVGRMSKPIAPGNITINNMYRPKSITWRANQTKNYTLRFNRRNMNMTDQLYDQMSADQIPEAGVDYRIIVETTTDGTSWTQRTTQFIAVNALDITEFIPDNSIGFRVKISARASGNLSFQEQSLTVDILEA